MKLYLVIPCYNEEEVLPETAARLEEKFRTLIEGERITADSRIVFVNDGSRDRTWEIICALHEKNKLFRGISLSRNRGHQNALLAGLMTVKEECDAAISMDADLQDDINAIDEMIGKYDEGYDVVYGVRSSRKKDTLFKRGTAQAFYRLMRAMGVESVYNHADYRLMSRRALLGLSEFKEVNLFLRGMVPLVGFRSTTVSYERGERFAGTSKYPLKKMLAFAFEGITSLSIKPIRMIATLGLLIFLGSIGMAIWSIVRFFMGYTVSGWASLAVSIWALGGIQLLAIGVIGEYIGKIYLETKHRPTFLISDYLSDD
ncbi:MAG: glycosyltransferase family 2 protein [Ruminococcaceae bacterium]|nr:glycosyltransferase family 2 protein [Oscillospiraceae bacterium]